MVVTESQCFPWINTGQSLCLISKELILVVLVILHFIKEKNIGVTHCIIFGDIMTLHTLFYYFLI